MGKDRPSDQSSPRSGGWGKTVVLGLVLLVGVGFAVSRIMAPNGEGGEARAEQISPPKIAKEGVDPAVVAAIDEATSKVVAQDDSANNWGQLGMVLLAHEFNHQAGICFEQAAKLGPTDAKWPYLHARSLLLTAPDQSVPLLLQAVGICGNRPAAPRLTLVETLLELYKLEEAEAQLLLFESDFRSDPRARLARARLSFLRNDSKDCLKQLQSLGNYLSKLPNYRTRLQPLMLMMSECLRREGEAERAERVRKEGLEHGMPAWPDPYYRLVRQQKTGLKAMLIAADLSFGRKEFEESIQILEKAIQSYPESVWARILLGRALIRTGAPDSTRADRTSRLQRAQDVLRGALELDPNSVEAIFRLAVAKGYAGEPEESARLYARAVEIKPDFTMAHYNLALNLRERGELEAAVQAMSKAVAAEPDLATGHVQLGDMLMRLERYDEAVKHLELAVKFNPNDQRFRSLLSRARALRARENAN